MKISFVCKHNIFRSRIAEEYMKKVSDYDVSSFGLFTTKGFAMPEQVFEARKRGLDLSQNSKPALVEDLKRLDYLVIVADDVPEEVFMRESYGLRGKVIRWSIADTEDGRGAGKIIDDITSRIDSFVQEYKQNGFVLANHY